MCQKVEQVCQVSDFSLAEKWATKMWAEVPEYDLNLPSEILL